MKEKFASLKKLNVGTVMSAAQQKNVLGGYSYINVIYCYRNNTLLGSLEGGRPSADPLRSCQFSFPQSTRAYQTVKMVDY